MAAEIERKFLVSDISVLKGRQGVAMAQGYVAHGPLTTRVRQAGGRAFLTLKGPRQGIYCDEFEYEIPFLDALAMLENYSMGNVVRKTRYRVPVGLHTFEVDVFEGFLAGLVTAEVELTHAAEEVELPAWLGREVSCDSAYANSNLAQLGVNDPRPPFH